MSDAGPIRGIAMIAELETASSTTVPLSTVTLSDKEFNTIRMLVYERFGINLTEQKRSLVIGRLHKLIQLKGFRSFREYCKYVLSDHTRQALLELANRISTNHTFFYREKAHFDFFTKTALPQVKRALDAANSRDLRVWCAGCSTGEEPYTLVMLMLEHFGTAYESWDAGVLATDISEQALAFAREGLYPGERLALLPPALRNKYFKPAGDGNWAIHERVVREATFRRFNLMNERYPFKKPFHIVFCRNVMIYFDQPTRNRLVERFHRHTAPGGYLFVGHAESLGRERNPYEYVMPAVYRRGSD